MSKMIGRMALAILMLSGGMTALPVRAQQERLVVIANDETVGFVEAERHGNQVVIRHDVKNNGRGPTMRETIDLDAEGLPLRWDLQGTTTFGASVHERFARQGKSARWTDSSGAQAEQVNGAALYIAQNASPWALGIYARALLKVDGGRLAALPGGEVRIEKLGEQMIGTARYRAYAISGIDLSPDLILLDGQDRLFAILGTGGAVVREGHQADVPALTQLAAQLTARRYAELQRRFAHHVDGPVRIHNVRVFDPASGKLGDPVAVLFADGRITGIQPIDAPASPGERLIDGAGGTLLPGLHDMHAHVGLQSALLYLAAGVTTVRDMGNDNDFLRDLVHRIDAGEVAGPRIVANGFLEGRSPFSARNGIVADSESAAVDAVRWYAARGYWQVKIYNSMNPAWVPAIAREAHRLGMGVTGHIPAFTTADAMIAAGYDEITHINQLMLGWVLAPEEDTRTPLRLTAMRRTATLDLGAPRVMSTIDAMAARHIAFDPTAVTLELLMLSRNGRSSPSVAGYIDHLPINMQRRRRQAIAPIAGAEDDLAYRAAFEKVKQLLKLLHGRGVRLLPGTDDDTGLSVHRELEIYAEAGIAPAEVLKLASLGPAQYLGRDQESGSIARGKRADFLLLPGNPLEDLGQLRRIAMVVKDGTIYFPSEIYPAFGMKSFAPRPQLIFPIGNRTDRAVAHK